MDSAAVVGGAALDRWFDLLDGHGFRVGVRERLLVQSLLARLAVRGELPDGVAPMLALAAPLLCTSREQQRRYAALLRDFAAPGSATAATAAADDGAADPGAARRRRLNAIAIAATVLALLAWLAWRQAHPVAAVTPQQPAASAAAGPASVPASAPVAAAVAWQPFYVPPSTLPLQPPLQPRWSTPLRAALEGLALLSAAALLAAGLAGRRRAMALQGMRTDDDVEHHLLHDAAPADVAPHPVLARAVGRALRQRVAGESLVLDAAATLRATVAARGAFSPRWRELRRTPEYLALVDSRHPSDHHAAYAHVLLDALARAGVAVQVYGYDTTPQSGCWQRGAVGNDDAATRQHLSPATLATRAARGRLLVFGGAEALLHPATGELLPWVAPLRLMAERAWFTPVPPHAWGAAEQAADEAGFLVLPLQEAALPTLAGWLTSRRLTLALDADTPQSVPPLLRGAALEWVTRSESPPDETCATLLRDLRRMLGGTRYQWLCACAVFPALTPPLTLALGRHLVADPRGLALGLAALSALPWFRYGRMPQWLRRRLLEQLAPDLRATLDAEVRQRLDNALDAAAGDGNAALADIGTRRRRLLAALSRRHGPLQDVVLADFVRRDTDLGLAQKLPEALRRRLFRNGDPGAGLRPQALALPCLLVVAGALAATPLWPALVGTTPQPALAELQAGTAAVRDSAYLAPLREPGVALLSFGETLLRVPLAQAPGVDFTIGAEPGASAFQRELSGALAAAMVPLRATTTDGIGIDTGSGLRLRDAAGNAVGAPLDTHGQPVLAAGFTPSGSRLVALLGDGRLLSWGRPWPDVQIDVVGCAGQDPAAGSARRVAEQLGETYGRLAVAYEARTWAELRPDAAAGLPLGAGEIRISEPSSRAQADFLAQWMAKQSGFEATTAWRVQAVGGAVPIVAIGTCGAQPVAPPTRRPAIDGLDDAAVDALLLRVQGLYAANAAERDAALAALLADRERFSDAVPLALWNAAQMAKAVGPDRVQHDAGLLQTLRLLQAALPATLRRAHADVAAVLALAAGRDAAVIAAAAGVQQRLAAAAASKPIIYLQIADEAQRPLATLLVQRLRANGLEPAGIENIGKRAPAVPELRVQGHSDRTIARNLVAASRSTLQVAAKLVTLSAMPANDTYEIWLDAALCVTRMAPGCGEAGSRAAPTSWPGPSSAALSLIARFEGFQPQPYKSGSGRSVIGYGHLLTSDELSRGQAGGIDFGAGITEAQANELLAADLQPIYAALARLVTVPLSDNQRAVLASYAFNAGLPALQKSGMLAALNAGNPAAVADELRRSASVAGKDFPGARLRREAEIALWNAGSAAAK